MVEAKTDLELRFFCEGVSSRENEGATMTKKNLFFFGFQDCVQDYDQTMTMFKTMISN